MAKLTDLPILVLFDDDRIQFTTPVTVTKDGFFNTTLPEETVMKLESYGPRLEPNRSGRRGFFTSDTLEDLKKQIENTVKEAISKELIEDKLVIKYEVNTRASYALDTDGEIIPNGYWRKKPSHGTGDPEFYNTNWREGNKHVSSLDKVTPSLSVFARVFHKKTFAYKSGKTITQLEAYMPKNRQERGGSLDWINSLTKMGPDTGVFNPDYNRLPEVEATEENAAFFVKLFKFVFQANELFRDFNKPEFLQNVIASGTIPMIQNV